MKNFLVSVVMLLGFFISLQAETFSTSTNSVQTLTIGTNEAIFITTLKHTGNLSDPLLATVTQNSNTSVLPLLTKLGWGTTPAYAFAGPMTIQFQQANVVMEFQRVQTTNVFTTIFNASNGVVINVPTNKTVKFLQPISWFYLNDVDNAYPAALLTLSNSTTVVKDSLDGGENFSEPVDITLIAGYSGIGNTFTNGWVTYYFTEEFAALPIVGATTVPAGTSMIAIEKSQDLAHWNTIFFKLVGTDQTGFYRFKVSN